MKPLPACRLAYYLGQSQEQNPCSAQRIYEHSYPGFSIWATKILLELYHTAIRPSCSCPPRSFTDKEFSWEQWYLYRHRSYQRRDKAQFRYSLWSNRRHKAQDPTRLHSQRPRLHVVVNEIRYTKKSLTLPTFNTAARIAVLLEVMYMDNEFELSPRSVIIYSPASIFFV